MLLKAVGNGRPVCGWIRIIGHKEISIREFLPLNCRCVGVDNQKLPHHAPVLVPQKVARVHIRDHGVRKIQKSGNMVSGHFFVRLQPDLEGIRPYADALIGFKHLFTQTRIQNEGFEDIEIARSTNFNDTALSYGVGGGVQFQVYGGSQEKGPSAAYIDLGVKYLIGSRAGYLKEGSIRREDGNVTFDVTNSDTSMLVVQLGVAVRF